MPVSPLTPLSLVASVNLQYLRDAFSDLKNKHGFYVDTGTWCCRTCAAANAKEEGAGQSFVFWHEQNEDGLHEYPSFEMPLCYGVAKKDASDDEIVGAARQIISVLKECDFKCDWKDGEIESPIMVHLDSHEPDLEDEADYFESYQSVCLYVPENEDTKEFCMNESDEDLGEPKDTFNFYQEIEDGESLVDAILRMDQKVWKHITHYQRFVGMGEWPVEPLFEIDQPQGGFCSACDESLWDLLKKETNKKEGATKEIMDNEVQPEKLLIAHNSLKYLGFIKEQGYEFDLSSKGIEVYLNSDEDKDSFYKKFEEWNQ